MDTQNMIQWIKERLFGEAGRAKAKKKKQFRHRSLKNRRYYKGQLNSMSRWQQSPISASKQNALI